MGAALADRVPGCAGVQQVWITGHPGDGEGGAPKGLRCMGVPTVQMYRTPFPIPSTEHIKVMLQVPFSDMFTDFMVTQGFCSCSVGTVAMRALLICLPQQERAERRQ